MGESDDRRGTGGERRAIAVASALVVLIAATTGAYWIGQTDGAEQIHSAQLDAADARREHAACVERATAEAAEAAARLESVREAPSCPERYRVTTDATVSDATGATEVRRGETCRVELEWWSSGDQHNCRVHARCGATRLYGDVGLGFFECQRASDHIRSGVDRMASSEDDDPMLELDGATLRIHDESPTWSATLALAETRVPVRADVEGL